MVRGAAHDPNAAARKREAARKRAAAQKRRAAAAPEANAAANVLNQAGEAMQAAADVVVATAAPAPKKPRKYLNLPAYDWSQVNLKDLQDFARLKGIHFSPDDTKETLQAYLARWAETGFKNKRKTTIGPRNKRKTPETRKPRERHYGPRLPRKTRSDKGVKKGSLKKDGTPRKVRKDKGQKKKK